MLKKPSLLDRLKAGIQKTRAGLLEKIEDAVSGRKEIDAEVLDELEYALITADIGARTTAEILERIRQRVERHMVADSAQLKSLIKEHLLEILEATERPLPHVAEPPEVILVVGVNGAGKTTSIGKLTRRLQSEGKTVLLCAADTFRAAAIEQLEVWAQRAGADLIRQQPGSDPSAVLFDALQAGKARKVDVVIADTAGRLHTKVNLMAELEKMRRTAARVIPDAPHEVLLVLEATTGQNGLEQARKFTESSAVTGIVLTKLDGTAKGGVVVAISRELNLPIRYVGVGETDRRSAALRSAGVRLVAVRLMEAAMPVLASLAGVIRITHKPPDDVAHAPTRAVSRLFATVRRAATQRRNPSVARSGDAARKSACATSLPKTPGERFRVMEEPDQGSGAGLLGAEPASAPQRVGRKAGYNA